MKGIHSKKCQALKIFKGRPGQKGGVRTPCPHPPSAPEFWTISAGTNSIVANRPDLPGKVPLIRPCPASRPTEGSFNGLSRWLPSRAENSCTLTLARQLARMLSQRLQRVARPLTAVLYLEMQCSGQLLLQVRVSINFLLAVS